MTAPQGASQEQSSHIIPESAYVFSNDRQEGVRLDNQYKILKKSFGNNVLYTPVSLSSEAEVLDSGCGTEAWVKDMSHVFPLVKIIGIDMSTNLFPQNSANITFLKHSILSLPRTWTNKFDLVHQSVLFSALTISEWPIALAEILRVTKPGGSVQLMEPVFGIRADRHMYHVANALGRARNLLIDDRFGALKNMLKDVGCINVTMARSSFAPEEWSDEERMLARGTYISAIASIKDVLLGSGGTPGVETAEEFDELMEACEDDGPEVGSIDGPDYEAWAFYATKP
ncbi:S-adenosyl-L-methionine-dependent methyltransferase [Coniophora puteana RWD-64-598 SS2]|uniref:S-adenosyl-L-methionine-dependent methyltransferase n=1 Tax=Coniophora puteana (strain RWD-64-598) TaxID=741705 RepID=A0A5M3MC36_CONPW|nr:S-adenosyl-L-methionine-dependent methyltransferase [Coniophora puteana RWD-64-598 SS2]EIW76596.1 S-adenosyl-L-methionine-dependent methyltransferase [Coniophora puteana RWD-64-598 SS2]